MRSASLVVFECLSKACAPPPVGSGGSKPSSTSVVPRDTRPKVRASDKHPEAPGAGDTSVVRGHRGEHGDLPDRRIPRLGETVDVYRDLGKGNEHKRGFPDKMAFSVRMASSQSGDSTLKAGNVAASTVGMRMSNPRPAWANAAKTAAETTGKRGVHAFLRGEVQAYEDPAKMLERVRSEPGWEEVTYYPGSEDFFRRSDRRRFVGAAEAVLANGEMWVRGARFHSRPAPVSAIEKKMQQAQQFGVRTSLVR